MVSKIASKIADLRMPHEWWGKTRSMKRDFHLHLGPTNSGKTYSALEVLKKSKTGVYCGPLRLLATEIYDKLTNSGIKCSLFTGQETRIDPNATHISCTLEAINLEKDYDCALIDEIQMIEDYNRGSAWTYAVLGLRAQEIHLTGDPRSTRIIQSLLKETKDNLIVHNYERLSPLMISSPVNNIKELQPGDCLVAFSRIKCHALKNYIEKFQPGSCSIIYGRLPPQVRISQAEKFNSGKHQYLISTDAIGMGLNYNINRVIFTEIKKNNGKYIKNLTPIEIKQISGRAGRFERKGLVTATSLEKTSNIIMGINSSINNTIKQAAITPMFEMLEEFINQTNSSNPKTYIEIIKMFKTEAKLENLYFLESFEEACTIANKIKYLNLPYDLVHKIANSKVTLNYASSIGKIIEYSILFSEQKPVIFKDFQEDLESQNLQILEMLYSFSENYIALSKKLGTENFVDFQEVSDYKQKISNIIDEKINVDCDNMFGFDFKKQGFLDVFY
jgi:ATP-dependent RNA helicase SUPV3L1/SUV3